MSKQDPVVPETDEFGAVQEVTVAPATTQEVVLRMTRAAEPAVDATLTLTSRGDGAVTGEYALPPGAC